jgi:hypothetical protein
VTNAMHSITIAACFAAPPRPVLFMAVLLVVWPVEQDVVELGAALPGTGEKERVAP